MTRQRDLKEQVRDRMAKTGERYAAARRHVVGAAAGGGSLRGWSVRGTAPEDYDFDVDSGQGRDGRSVRLRARVEAPRGFGTLAQTILADDYRGKRLRWSAWLKTADLRERAALWMRVDDARDEVLVIDNMDRRPLRGTADWGRYEVVLDVPEQGAVIHFGVLLSGAGTTWMADVALETVGPSVPPTASPLLRPRSPQNLSFDE